MQTNLSSTSQIILTMILLIVASLSNLHAAYEPGECWVISNGDTVYRLLPDGTADPTVIPNLTQAQTAEVNPKNGIVWIAVSAANTVYKYNPATSEVKPVPDINRPRAISINPVDGAAWIGGLDVVVKVSAEGQVVATIPGVYEPEVAVNSTDGSCWVTDSRGKIARYNADGTPAVVSPVVLKEPKFVTVNPKTGNAWVADNQSSVVVKLNANGQELLRFTDIQAPSSPRVNPRDGSLWIVSNASSLIKLSADGKKVLEIPGAGMAILSISVDARDGSLWVADQFGSTFTGGVSKFSAAGQQLFENPIPLPSSVSVGYWAGQ